jgi:hypothetical protein
MKKFTTEEQRLKKNAYNIEYRKQNKEKLKLKMKEDYEKNKPIFAERMKNWHEKNKAVNNKKKKIYWDKNKKEINSKRNLRQDIINKQTNEYYKKRRAVDPLFKLKSNIRSLISNYIIKGGYIKKTKSQQILGCTFEEFKNYLESKFEPWMNWENFGNPKDKVFEINKTWDIDHIIPISSATTEEDIIRLNHYTNLQPLCSVNNRWIKRNKN